MKRFIYLLAAVTVLVSGCFENRQLGGWDPMELSTEELIFGSNGGQEDVYCFNRPPMIHDIWNKILGQYYYADLLNQKPYNCSAPGISVSIIDDKITVKVEPSNEKREWGIRLWSGDSTVMYCSYSLAVSLLKLCSASRGLFGSILLMRDSGIAILCSVARKEKIMTFTALTVLSPVITGRVSTLQNRKRLIISDIQNTSVLTPCTKRRVSTLERIRQA